MTQTLQFEQHPDADQISAFVESALPAHERERLLDHLAVCPDCRQIVALSLPERPHLAQPALQRPEPIRRSIARLPWASILAWPLAGALAAAIFLVVHFRARVAPQQQQIAAARAPLPPSSEELPQASAPPVLTRQPLPSDQIHTATAGNATAAPSAADHILSRKEPVRSVAITGRNAAELVKMQPGLSIATGSSVGQAALETQPGSPAAAGAANGLAAAASPTDIGSLQSAPPQVQVSGKAILSQPPANAAVSVTAADAGIPTATPSLSATSSLVTLNPIPPAPLKHPLPSRLPVLCIAAQDRRMVAIDTGSSVFVSTDQGIHWKPIRAQWQGRPVKIDLVDASAQPLRTASPDKSGAAGTLHQNSLATDSIIGPTVVRQAGAPANAPGLTGTVTDLSGAVVPGASVTAINSATGSARIVKTDNSGHFAMDGLAPGAYRVQAQAPGFKKQDLAVLVPQGAPTMANISLAVAEASQSVTVDAATLDSAAQPITAAKQKPNPAAPPKPGLLFQIVTDAGDRWTSTNGIDWNQEQLPPQN